LLDRFSRRRGLSAFALAALIAWPAAMAGAATGSSPLAQEEIAAEEKAAHDHPVPIEKQLCGLIEQAAKDEGLPIGFFTRLIWKESRFRADAVSPKGAQGIAQFMPFTAAERELLDPFDPTLAIPASARLLAELKIRFGNLGLAAAAYNAGANRVSSWLAEAATLPFETQDYVLAITGIPAETWAGPDPVPDAADDKAKDCLALAVALKLPGDSLSPDIETAQGPWGVQVAGNFSRAKAIAAYSGLQKRFPSLLRGRPPMIIATRVGGRGNHVLYRMRVPLQSKQEADRFCDSLQQAGGDCIVFRN
jgi:hypothetical protein